MCKAKIWRKRKRDGELNQLTACSKVTKTDFCSFHKKGLLVPKNLDL